MAKLEACRRASNAAVRSSPRKIAERGSGFGEFKHHRLGTGIVDPAPAAKAMNDVGYDGYTVLEIIPDAAQRGNGPDGDIVGSYDILARRGWEMRAR